MWSYKIHDYPSEWGLYDHFLYDEKLPDFSQDDFETLKKKLSKYDTAHHIPNSSLIKIVKDHLNDVQTGARISASINPPAAVSAGAQWRMDKGPDISWKSDGAQLTEIPADTYKIIFRSLFGWTKPATQTINVVDGSVIFAAGVYTPLPTGSVRVNLNPADVVTAGAQWRLKRGQNMAWHNSGETISPIPIGSNKIIFKTIKKWIRPADKIIRINANNAVNVTGRYQSRR